METSGVRQEREERRSSASTWSAIAVLCLAAAAGGITARIEGGPRYDWLLLMVAILAVGAVAMRLLADSSAEREEANRYAGDPLKDLLDSAGSLIISVDLGGRVTFVNPTAERLLGYHAAEMVDKVKAADLLAPSEGARLVMEMQRISGIEHRPDQNRGGRIETFREIVRALPPSQTPSFETQLRRKDNALIPVRLHLSTLRNREGEAIGLVAVGLDQSSSAPRKDQWKVEARERYRDVFENSSEMIATLDLTGRFLYVNPAWKRCFAQNQGSPDREFFEEAFSTDSRADAAALMRRVLEGETIDRAPIRNETAEGHLQELEVSLHQRRRAGKAMAVQCMFAM